MKIFTAVSLVSCALSGGDPMITGMLYLFHLVQIMQLFPKGAQVEVAVFVWSRLADLFPFWEHIVGLLSDRQQADLGRRLGYLNIFNPSKALFTVQSFAETTASGILNVIVQQGKFQCE